MAICGGSWAIRDGQFGAKNFTRVAHRVECPSDLSRYLMPQPLTSDTHALVFNTAKFGTPGRSLGSWLHVARGDFVWAEDAAVIVAHAVRSNPGH